LVDELFYAKEEMMAATTNMVTLEQNAGGVARNLAHQLALLGIPVSLIAAFGDDADGIWLADECRHSGIDLSMSAFGIHCRTGKYTGIINPDGSLFTAMLSNDCNALINSSHLEVYRNALLDAAFIIADTNLSVEALQWLTQFSRDTLVPLIIEPVSVPPAKKLQQADLSNVYMVTPNEDELPALLYEKHANNDKTARSLIEKGVQHVWLHEGSKGSKIYTKENIIHVAAQKTAVLDSTGAGDASLAGFVWGLYHGKSLVESIRIGHWLAAEILKVKGAIAKHITHEHLSALIFTHDE
jgi:pseudouridine kinase